MGRFVDFSHHAAWHRQLDLLLQSTGEGFYGIDLDGRCNFINRAGAEMLGYRPDEVLGRNMHDLIHHTRADGTGYPVNDCPIMRAFQIGEGCRLDSEVLWRRNGTSFPAEYSSFPVRDADKIIGAVVTFTDVTDRKQAESALRDAHDELERRVAERTDMLTKANERLRQSHSALQRLSAHLNTVREEERKHIAREIHDQLGASLTALQLGLGWISSKVVDNCELVAKISDMRGLADEALVAVQRIISDLRPSVIDHLGLWAALEWQMQEFHERTGLATRINYAQPIEATRLAKPAEIAVYRIVQEVLTNVARHAHAHAVTMEVAPEISGVRMVIRDDGCGMQVPQQPATFGLLGMHERARGLGGELRIYSDFGSGTAVCLRVPYPNG